MNTFNLKESMEHLNKLKEENATSQKKGLPFMMASVLIWTIILIIRLLDMKTGDCIFLYTDGLNEAEDISHNQFEMERVRQVLSTTINKPQTLIEAMTSSVKMFVGNAEQSDDLTMLAIKYTLQ